MTFIGGLRPTQFFMWSGNIGSGLELRVPVRAFRSGERPRHLRVSLQYDLSHMHDVHDGLWHVVSCYAHRMHTSYTMPVPTLTLTLTLAPTPIRVCYSDLGPSELQKNSPRSRAGRQSGERGTGCHRTGWSAARCGQSEIQESANKESLSLNFMGPPRT